MTATDDEIFGLADAERLKREGMALGAENRKEQLDLARYIAREIGKVRGICHADMVGRVLKSHYNIETLGPAAGSLFKGGDWEFTGEWYKSRRKTNHARMIRIWRYVGA